MTLKSGLLDALTGILGLVPVVIADPVRAMKFDLRALSMVSAAVYLLAGLVRGKSGPRNPWLKGLLVDSGSLLLVTGLSLTGQAFDWKPVLVMFPVVTALFAVCGVQVRRVWVSGLRAGSALMALLSMAEIAQRLDTIVADRVGRKFRLDEF